MKTAKELNRIATNRNTSLAIFKALEPAMGVAASQGKFSIIFTTGEDLMVEEELKELSLFEYKIERIEAENSYKISWQLPIVEEMKKAVEEPKDIE